MTIAKKQLKITRLFRRPGLATQIPEDYEELQAEIEQLRDQLREKHNELFQLQRNSYRAKRSPPKKKSEPFVRPEKIVRANSVESLKNNLGLMALLSGMEVQSYVADDHCSIVYHMQHKSEHEVKHGLRIDMKNGDNRVSKTSLPVGFNLPAVLEDFDNVMLPECLVGIRKALYAYYDRLEQISHLTKLLNLEGELFKVLDGSHVEVTFEARSEHDAEEDSIKVTLILDYRVYDIRPKHYSFVEIDMPEGSVEVLRDQCSVFKKKPLHKAFKEVFIRGNGTYVMVRQQVDVEEVRPRRKRPRPVHHNHDDTFHPEDCSTTDDDDAPH